MTHNACEITFICDMEKAGSCMYRKESPVGWCSHQSGQHCNNSMAQANSMILLLKEGGILK